MPAVVGRWTGQRAKISAIMFGLDCMVTIEQTTIAPVEASRQQLGLD
jgi:hypothetical protein